jgi:hypothetical protein
MMTTKLLSHHAVAVGIEHPTGMERQAIQTRSTPTNTCQVPEVRLGGKLVRCVRQHKEPHTHTQLDTHVSAVNADMPSGMVPDSELSCRHRDLNHIGVNEECKCKRKWTLN